MIQINLIRHGKTQGNLLRRYIGTTDEPLCSEGMEQIRGRKYPDAEAVFISPRKRCMETAHIIYPDTISLVLEDLAECDFGDFENKNAVELEDNQDYQDWIDSGGRLPFPNGESREQFAKRSVDGFLQAVDICQKTKIKCASLVVHGGTIMSIMEAFAWPKEDYYFWQPKNGDGFILYISEDMDYEMDTAGSSAGIYTGSDTGRSQVVVSSSQTNREADFSGRKNYQRLFAEE